MRFAALQRSGLGAVTRIQQRRMAGGPIPASYKVKKNKFVEEWNGRREITEKSFTARPKKVLSIFFYVVVVPYGFYTLTRSEFQRLEITAAFLRQYSKPMRLRTLSTRVNGTKPDMEGWTVDRTLRESIERLQANNVTEPEQSVPHLLSASLGLSWKSGYREISTLSKDVALTKEQAHDFAEKLNRRLNHEPLQYILGQWDFLDYTIAIEPPLLCPRPETEELVMKVFKEANPNPTQILDVGCGTGVIGVSLAAKLPNATVEAIDIDPVAVKVSMQNAKRILGTSPDSRYKVNLCAARDYVPDRRFDIVVSNPPYIPKADMTLLSEDVAQYESESALCGGIDGMDVIRTILKQLPKWCNCGAVCWMEVDPTHPQIIEQWIGDSDLPVEFESSYKDMFGKERFVKLSIL